jgi:hypothetical protein
MAVKTGKRELIDTGADKRFVKRRKDGTFKESVDVGRSLAADRRSKSKQSRSLGKAIKAINLSEARKRVQRRVRRAPPKGQERKPQKSNVAADAHVGTADLGYKAGGPFFRGGWLFEPKWDGFIESMREPSGWWPRSANTLDEHFVGG